MGTSQRLPAVLTFQRTCERSQVIFDSQRIDLGKLVSGIHAYLPNETNLARGKGGGVQTSVLRIVEAHWDPRKRRVIDAVGQFPDCEGAIVPADINGITLQHYL
jgi:hypothetical protein